MKYLKRFSKVSDYEAFKTGNDYITPNISLIDDGKRVYSEKKINNEGNLITFTVNGTEYQAEEGMTWEEWVNSEYNGKIDEQERFNVNQEHNRIQSSYFGYFVIDAYGEYVVSTDIINSHNYNFQIAEAG